jgi:hypothetical protein
MTDYSCMCQHEEVLSGYHMCYFAIHKIQWSDPKWLIKTRRYAAPQYHPGHKTQHTTMTLLGPTLSLVAYPHCDNPLVRLANLTGFVPSFGLEIVRSVLEDSKFSNHLQAFPKD